MRRQTAKWRTAITVIAAGVLMVLFTPGELEAQSSDDCESVTRCPTDGESSHGGDANGGGYDAWALYASVAGEGRRSSPVPCEGTNNSAEAPRPGHIEVETFGPFGEEYTSGDYAGGFYIVNHLCMLDGPPGTEPEVHGIGNWLVPVGDPQDLIDQALSALDVPAPEVSTNPGDGNPSLVNFDTWLMLEEDSVQPVMASQPSDDGLLRVDVWAHPTPDGQVTWDTGEDEVVCYGNGLPEGSCSYSYQRSSLDEEGTGPMGRPAYQITASVTYTGGYNVYLGGQLIGGSGDQPDIQRTSAPYYLEVEEAQALNTGND